MMRACVYYGRRATAAAVTMATTKLTTKVLWLYSVRACYSYYSALCVEFFFPHRSKTNALASLQRMIKKKKCSNNNNNNNNTFNTYKIK